VKAPETGGEPPAVAAPLYALPPDEFVAARDALARRLAEERDPAAATVRKLRRPVGLAWVLNHLGQSEKDRVGALLAAGEKLRAAQTAALEGRDASALREAEQELRDGARALRLAAAPVLAQAGRSPPAVTMAHLEVLLRGLATAPEEQRARFRSGVLAREPDVAGGFLEGFPVPAAPPTKAGPAAPAPAAPPARGKPRAERQGRARERAEELERRRDAETRRRDEAAAKARARERAKLVAEARRALASADAQRAKRTAAVEEAQARLEEARAELEEARAALEAAEGEARRARERLGALEEEAGAHGPRDAPPRTR